MSNELRGSRITNLKQESENEEERSFAIETSMLIKSSKVGCEINLGEGGDDNTVDLDENYFMGAYKRERSKSLSALMDGMDINLLGDWSNDSFDRKHLDLKGIKEECRIVLGVGAESSLLEQPATPTTPGPKKRIFSPEKKTPRGRPRKFSTSQMGSPALRLNLVSIIPDEEDGKVINETRSRHHPVGTSSTPSGSEIFSRGRVQASPASGQVLTIAGLSVPPAESYCGRATNESTPGSGRGQGTRVVGVGSGRDQVAHELTAGSARAQAQVPVRPVFDQGKGSSSTASISKIEVSSKMFGMIEEVKCEQNIFKTPIRNGGSTRKRIDRRTKSTPRRRRASLKEEDKNQWKISQLFPKEGGEKERREVALTGSPGTGGN